MRHDTSPVAEPDDETAEALTALQKYIQKQPVKFLQDNFKAQLYPKTAEIVESVFGVGKYKNSKKNRTTVRSCTNSSKTWTAGRVAWLFCMAYTDSMVLTTAPTWPQVKENIWKEIHHAYYASEIPLSPDPPNQVEFEFSKGWGMWGFSTKDARNALGRHAKHVLIILDDAPGVPAEVADAVENALSGGGNVHLLMLGNPDQSSGSFHSSHTSEADLYNCIHIDSTDTPNFRKDLPDNPNLITPLWASQRKEKWGETSPNYMAMVRGQFPTQDATSLIPVAWVDAAVERWKAFTGNVRDLGRGAVGVDPARFGDDDSVITALWGGRYCEEQVSRNGQDTAWTAEEVKNGAKSMDNPPIGVDAIGLGSGVADKLRFDKVKNVLDIVSSEKPTDEDEYHNLGDEMCCTLRDALHPKTGTDMMLPPDDLLKADLTTRRYKFIGGKVKVESKEDLKKKGRLGRSPDRGDSLANALWAHRSRDRKPTAPTGATSAIQQKSGLEQDMDKVGGGSPRGQSSFLEGMDS